PTFRQLMFDELARRREELTPLPSRFEASAGGAQRSVQRGELFRLRREPREAIEGRQLGGGSPQRMGLVLTADLDELLTDLRQHVSRDEPALNVAARSSARFQAPGEHQLVLERKIVVREDGSESLESLGVRYELRLDGRGAGPFAHPGPTAGHPAQELDGVD